MSKVLRVHSSDHDPEPDETGRLSRRRLLQQAAVGSAAATLGVGSTARYGPTATAQIVATPPTVPEPILSEQVGETVESRAALLGYDPKALFAFVRDEIHYEAYAGVLRGAQGTLWARAGNAADQAVLLAALLEAAQVPHRFATGPLDDDAADALASRVAPNADDVRASFERALAGLDDSTESDLSPLTDEDSETLEIVVDYGQRLRARALEISDATVERVGAALAAAGITLPSVTAAALPEMERQGHMWVQVADGPEWTDLDPSLPEQIAPPVPTETPDALPEDLHHRVRLRLVVEEVISGTLTRRDAATWDVTSAKIGLAPVGLIISGPEMFRGVGATLNQLFTGQVTLIPALLGADGADGATTPLVFGAGKDDTVLGALDAATEESVADGETVGVWLVAEVTSPGEPPVTVERPLLDRIGVAARIEGIWDPSAISPVTPVIGPDGRTTLAELEGLTLISAEVARLPLGYAAGDLPSRGIYGDVAMLGPALGALANGLVLSHGVEHGYVAYPARPNLTAFTFRRIDANAGTGEIEIIADIMLHHPAVVTLGDAAPEEERARLAAAAIRQAAEQVLVQPIVEVEGASRLAMNPTVSMVFEAAEAEGTPIVAITDPALVDGDGHSGDAVTRMRSALAQGMVVVAPARAVTVGGQAISGWWQIDPVSGRVEDLMERGLGYAGGRAQAGVPVAYATLPGWSRLVANVRQWAPAYTALGRCLAIVAAAAVRASDYTGAGTLVGAGIETFKNVDPNDLKGCLG